MARRSVVIRRWKDEAAVAFTKGKYAEAAGLYRQLLRLTPNDFQLWMRLGDAERRAGYVRKAVFAYGKAAAGYAHEGQLLRAIAAAKLLLEVDPAHEETQLLLASLYSRKDGRPSGAESSAGPSRGVTGSAAGAPLGRLSLLRGASFEHTPGGGFRSPGPNASPGPGGAFLSPGPNASPGPGGAFHSPGPSASPGPGGAFRSPGPNASPGPGGAFRSPGPNASPGPGGGFRSPGPNASPGPGGAFRSPGPAASPGPGASFLSPGPSGYRPGSRNPDGTLRTPEPVAAGPALVPGASQRPRPPARPSVPPILLSGREWSAGPEKVVEPSLGSPHLPESSGRWSLRGPAIVPPAPVSTPPPPLPQRNAEGAPGMLRFGSKRPDVALRADGEPFRLPEPEPIPEFAMGDDDDTVIDISLADPEIPTLAEWLPKVPLFSELDPPAFVQLVETCELRTLAAGERAVREGERGLSFFVVVRGQLRVVRENPTPTVLATLGEGDFFGEMALLSGEPRTASVLAAGSCELLEISATALRGLVRAHPSVAEALRRFWRQRLLANVLATAPIFQPLSPAQRRRLLTQFKSREVAPGDVLLQEGGNAEGLFVVLGGRVAVTKRSGDRQVLIGELRAGDVFGETSLLTSDGATATCTAASRGMVLRLPVLAFDSVAEAHPEVVSLVADLSARRQRANSTRFGAATG